MMNQLRAAMHTLLKPADSEITTPMASRRGPTSCKRCGPAGQARRRIAVWALAPTLLSGLALGIGLLVSAGNLQAATLIWTNGNGNFNDGTKWDTGAAPVDGDNTWFTNGISYTVAFPVAPALINSNLVTGSGTVTYNIGTNTWTITNGFSVGGDGDTGAVYLASGTLLVTNRGLFIGDATNVVGATAVTNGVGTFVVTNGIVRSVNTVLGGGSASRGTLIIRDSGVWTNIPAGLGPITVGKSTSNNLLVVADGGKLFTSSATISTAGENWSNTGLVYGASSLWTNLGDLSVGGTCGALIISNGGKLAVLGTLTAGNLGSSTGCVVQIGGFGSVVNAYVYGTIKVGGNSSTLDSVLMVTNALLTSGSLNMGSGGASYGTAYVLAGATWNMTGKSFKIGAISGSASSNNVCIINQGVVTNIGSAQMGGTLCNQSGLIVTNSGKMFQSTEATIGGRNGSVSNFAIVTGAGSVWNVGTNMSVGSGLINPDEIHENWLLVTDSGVITNVETLNLANNAGTSTDGLYMYGNHVVITNGGKLFANANLRIANGKNATNNWMQVIDGSMFSAGGDASVGYTNASNYGNALYVGGVGAASVVSIASNVTVGDNGSLQDTMVVTNGLLTARDLTIGGTNAGFEGTNNTVIIGTGGSVLLVGTTTVFATNTLDMQGGTLVAPGAVYGFGTVQGFGTVVGDTIITNDGFLGVSNSLGQLTVSNLTLFSGATTTVELGTNFNTTVVNNNLTLDGILNFADSGGFNGGTFTLFSYGGTLTTNGTPTIMTIVTTPDPSIIYTLDISSNGFVILHAAPLPPVAGFSGSPTTGAVALAVTFTDSSTGNITNRSWVFGDGGTTNFTTVTNFVYTYNTVGTNTVSLTVSGLGGSDSKTNSNYIVVLCAPQLVVSPGSRDYGTLTVGQTNSLNFSVINAGCWSLIGTAVGAGPFAVSTGSPYTVSPGQTGIVTVAFAPSSGGDFTNDVIFASNGGVSTNQVTGVGLTQGSITVTPANYGFPNTTISLTNETTFVVTNTGGTAVTNGTASMVTSNTPFSVVSNATFSVAAFGSTNVVVQFAPVDYGVFTNNVAFDTANGGHSTNQVTGSAGTPPCISVTPATYGFPNTTIGMTNQTTFVVTNTGSAAVTNGTAAMETGGSPFSIVSNATFSVAGFGSTNVVVQFVPVAAGVFTNNVVFGGGNGCVSTNQVTGIGLTPGSITVTPTSYNFSTITTGMTEQATLVVTNSGGTAVSSGTATSSAPFSIVSGSTFTVPGYGTTNVVVQFAPVTQGVSSNSVGFATANGGSATISVTGTSTNAPWDTNAPTLTILSPTDNEVFTNTAITVDGTASDANGIAGVTVNGAAASGTTNWTDAFTLSLGTNTITVIATDNSYNHNMATQIVHAIYAPTNHPPVIISPPVVTNALLQVDGMAVVIGGETNTFSVGAIDPDSDTLSYRWLFGDGVTNGWSPSNTAQHAYTTNCGPYTAGVSVSDGDLTVSSNLTVVIACDLAIKKMQLKLNFAKANADGASLSVTNLDLGAGFGVTNKVVRVDIGGTTNVVFTLDAKGKGVSGLGSCKLTYNKKTLRWTLTAKLAKGSWQTAWAGYGLVNADVPKTPPTTVTMPVVVVIGTDAFAAEHTMFYTAKAGKSGKAK